MPLITRVHNYQVDKMNKARMLSVRPYIRLSEKDQGVVYLQSGRVWSETDGEMKPVPDWALKQINKLSREARKKVDLPEEGEISFDKQKPEPKPVPIETPTESAQSSGDSGDMPHATPAAISLADDLGLDIMLITGTGANGTITTGDVKSAETAD